MKKRKLMVRKMALDVRQVNNDLRSDYGVCPLADREMTTLEKKVSPQLYGMPERGHGARRVLHMDRQRAGNHQEGFS